MILDDIVAFTRKRVENLKNEYLPGELKQKAEAMPKGDFAFHKSISKEGLSYICEVKKASPSKGVISENFPYKLIAEEYEEAGADAVSVLTEPQFFKGSSSYLREIADIVKIPVLRKDFIIDESQIYEAKLIGADAVLLICAILNDSVLKNYIEIAGGLGVSCLVEAHDEKEIEMALKAGACIIGVNNRNLKTFKVDTGRSIQLRKLVPRNILFVSESGIKTRDDIKLLEESGADAVLIGETFMRSKDKATELKRLRGLE